MTEIAIENYKPFEAQQRFHSATQRNKLYGGAMGGGKTRTLCEEVVQLMIDFPGNRGFIGRVHFSDFRITTYLALTEKVLKEHLRNGTVTENKGDKTFDFWNGSRLFYGGIKGSSGDNEKLFSSEFGVIAIDEAFEMLEEDFKKLGTRLRHSLPNGKHPDFYFLMASNPSQNWLKTRFISNPTSSNYIFVPALPKDNIYNPDDYEENMRELFDGDVQMIQAFIEGSWDSIGASNDLVTMDEIAECIDLPIVEQGSKRRYTVVDCSGEGGDLTFGSNWVAFKHDKKYCYKWLESKYKQRTRTSEIVLLGDELRLNNDSSDIFYDPIGEGKGAFDNHWEISKGKDYRVHKIDFRNTSFEPEDYYNLRAEGYWKVRKAIKNKAISLPDDNILHQELCSIKWKTVGGVKGSKIKILEKDEVKKELGRSPDRSDNCAMGVLGAEQAKEVKLVKVDKWNRNRREPVMNWRVA